MAKHTQTHISMIIHVHTGVTHYSKTVFTQFDLMLTQTQAKKRSIQQEVMLQSTVTGTLTNIHTVFGANRVGALC